MASITVDQLQVLITANAADLDKKLNAVKDKLNGTSKQTEGFQSKLQDLQPTFRKMAAIGTAAFAVIGAGIFKATKDAASLEKINNNFEITFGKSSKAVGAFAKDFGDQFGFVTSEMKQSANSIGFQLNTISGVSDKMKTEMTTNLLTAAGGLSDFFDGTISVADASKSMASAISGNTQSLIDMGFNVREADLKNIAYKNGIAKTGEELTRAQRAQALTKAVMEQTTGSVDGLSKNMDTYQTQMRFARKGMIELSQSIGSVFLPVAKNILKVVNPVIKSVSSWVKENPKLAGTIAAVAAGAAALVAVLGLVGMALPPIIAGFGLLFSPVTAVVAAVAAVVAVFVLLEKRFGIFSRLWGSLVEFMQPAIDFFNQSVWPILQQIGNFMKDVFAMALQRVITAFQDLYTALEPVMPILEKIGLAILGSLVAPLAVLVAGVVAVIAIFAAVVTGIAWAVGKVAEYVSFMVNKWKEAWDEIKQGWEDLKEAAGKIVDAIGKFFSDGVETVKQVWSPIANWFADVWAKIKAIFSVVAGWFRSIFDSAKNQVTSAFSPVVGFFSNMWGSIKRALSDVVGWFRSTFEEAVSAIKSIDWGKVGMDIIKGIGNGIGNTGEWLARKAVEAVEGAKNAIKNFFGIESPSTVMRDEVGKMIGKGMAIGIDDSSKDVTKSMKDLSTVSMGNFDSSVNVQHGFSDFSNGEKQPLIINVGGERLVDTVIEGINGRSFLGGSSVINV